MAQLLWHRHISQKLLYVGIHLSKPKLAWLRCWSYHGTAPSWRWSGCFSMTLFDVMKHVGAYVIVHTPLQMKITRLHIINH